MKLKDKVAVVTGATKGIGLGIAHEFLREGAKVVISGRSRELGEKHAAELSPLGPARFIACDVADSAEVNALVAGTVAAFGRLDIMVSNAGMNGKAQFLDVKEEDWDRIIAVNLKGVFLCGQAAARQMVRQGGGGVIINMSSVMAVLGLKEQVAYCASKGGINQLTKVMALNLIEHGIKVNAIGPGPIMTELMQRVARSNEGLESILKRTPYGRVGECEEVGRLAVFLASQDSDFILGQTIYNDGGRMIQSFDSDLHARQST
jgi:NAD(P)-dependent dehydrogenase (short-subunit alcohol dehydrogenase family)